MLLIAGLLLFAVADRSLLVWLLLLANQRLAAAAVDPNCLLLLLDSHWQAAGGGPLCLLLLLAPHWLAVAASSSLAGC